MDIILYPVKVVELGLILGAHLCHHAVSLSFTDESVLASVVPPSSQLAKHNESPGCKGFYNLVLPLSHLQSREGCGGAHGVGRGKWMWSACLWPLAHSRTGPLLGPLRGGWLPSPEQVP